MLFGKGYRLRDYCPSLRDPKERHARILDVVERDSVIEGLPRLNPATRARCLRTLKAVERQPVTRPRQSLSSDRSRD